MAERYTRLSYLPENQYTVGSPLLIAAGALLKDNQTGRVLAQIKFRSISEKRIKAIKVSILAFDVSGKELEGVSDYQYLDLSIGRNAEFGQKQAATLPDAVTRAIEVKCTDVFFTDGTTWHAEPNAKWMPLPVQPMLVNQLGDLAMQYQRDTSAKSKYIPLAHEDLWICSCGEQNRIGEPRCCRCRQEKTVLFDSLELDALRQRNVAYETAQAEMAAEMKIKKAEEQKVRDAKVKKISVITMALIAVAAILLASHAFISESNYNQAVALMDSGAYEDAIAAFELMNGYKDSNDKINACHDAIEAREKVITEEKYNKAISLMNQGNYQEASNIFSEISIYKDSADQLTVCECQCAFELMDTGLFSIGLGDFEEIIETASNKDLVREAYYQKAISLSQEKKYFDALQIFRVLDGYQDATEQILIQKIKIAGRNVIHASAFYTVGIKKDGTVLATGARWDVSKWKDIVAISAAELFIVGLRSDGTVVATGSNLFDQCNVENWKNIIAISVYDSHTVGLRRDGTVVATGSNVYGQCNVEKWTEVVAISAGRDHTAGLRSDGTVVATGSNRNGECDVDDWNDIIAIATGNSHTVGLRRDGTVVATGNNSSSQCDVENWKDIVAISVYGSHTVGLRSDGTAVATGNNSSGQCNVEKWTEVVAISTGRDHTVGLRSDGTVVATGDNEAGACDVGEWKNVVAISAGDAHTVGLRSDGTVVATGYNGGACDVDDWYDMMLPE